MEHQKIIDEINYAMAQTILNALLKSDMISIAQYDKITRINRRIFSPMYAELLPNTLDILANQR